MLKRSGLVRSTALGATAVVAALSLSACGGSSSGGSTAAPAPAPTAALATIPSLTGKMTSVKLDAGFTGALTTLKLTPGVIGSASLTDGSLNFPITGGNVKYFTPNGPVEPYVQGIIHHEGSGISLTGGGHVVKLENFTVDPGKSMLFAKVTADGKLVGGNVPVFFLDGTTLKPLAADPSAGTATLTGTKVELTKTAADALDGVFSTKAVTEGLLVGVATILVNTGS